VNNEIVERRADRTVRRLGLIQSVFWSLVGVFCLIAATSGPAVLLVVGSVTAGVGIFIGYASMRLLPR
jgi:hypothetical protein